MSDTFVELVVAPQADPVALFPAPQPDAARVIAAPAQPARTQEQTDHEAQVIRRPRRLDRAMMDFAAVGVSPGVRSLHVDEPIAELGTFTYFSLRRGWATAVDGKTSVVCMVYAGYKARLVGGRVEVGGAAGNVCAYDLRFRPFSEASEGGKILNSRKRTTVRLGLTLDEAVERCAKNARETDPLVRLPQFWAGFDPDSLPAVEDCQAARRVALSAVRPEYAGPVLPSLRSPGGVVSLVCPDAEGGIGVLFDEGTSREETVLLPRCAVLRPYVREGFKVEKGAPLADFLPRRMYPNMAKVAELFGQDVADWLLADAVAATDIDHLGLRLRRVELCPTQVEHATRVYEDVRTLLDENGLARPQVVRVKNGLLPLRPGNDAVTADFATVRPEWVHKFQPVKR